jgi:flagellar FliL protein
MSKKDDQPGEEGVKKEKSGKSNLVPALIIAFGLIVGGFLMGRGGGGTTAASAAAAPAPPTTEESGGVAVLAPVTMNLSDGRYLKVTIGLGLKKGKEPKAFLATGETAKALDLAMSQLSHYSSVELQPPAKREEAKKHLEESVIDAFGGDVLHLYVTEWVVQ